MEEPRLGFAKCKELSLAPFLNCCQRVPCPHDDVDATPLEDFEEHLPFESEDHDGAFASVALRPPRDRKEGSRPSWIEIGRKRCVCGVQVRRLRI